MEKKYNNINKCWSHGYDTIDLQTSDTCTITNVVHKKEAKRGYPMGGSQNNKARVWKKGLNRFRGDDQKHSTVNINDTTYNEI